MVREDGHCLQEGSYPTTIAGCDQCGKGEGWGKKW